MNGVIVILQWIIWIRQYNGADVNARCRDKTSIFEACWDARKEIVQMLIQYGADLNVKDDNSKTVLHHACNQEEILELLLTSGAEVNATDDRNQTALHLAAKGNNPKIVKLLLEFGADNSIKDEDGCTAFYIAALYCKTGNIESFLNFNHPFNVNEQNFGGNAPLHYACLLGLTECIELILHRGNGDVNITNAEGRTPLFNVCLESGHYYFGPYCLHRNVNHEQNKKNAEILIYSGANVNISDNRGLTPLMLACRSRNEKLVESLLNAEADIEMTDNHGNTALMFACDNNDPAIVELLLSRAANVNSTNHDGISPLHFACREGNRNIVRMLLQKGANPHVKNSKGQTPLDIAVEHNYNALVKLLLEY